MTRIVRRFSPESLGTGNYVNKCAWKISTQFGKEAAESSGIEFKKVINVK